MKEPNMFSFKYLSVTCAETARKASLLEPTANPLPLTSGNSYGLCTSTFKARGGLMLLSDRSPKVGMSMSPMYS